MRKNHSIECPGIAVAAAAALVLASACPGSSRSASRSAPPASPAVSLDSPDDPTTAASSAPERASPASDDRLAAARDRLAALIRDEYEPSTEGMTLAVTFPGALAELPAGAGAILDIETGNGHGFYLSLLRIALTGDGADLEHIEWRGRGKGAGSARRARVTAEQLAPLVDAVRVLPSVALAEAPDEQIVRAQGADGSSTTEVSFGGGWMSSNNFFVLVRAAASASAPASFEREFAGYAGSTDQLAYLPLLAVSAIARELVEGASGWVAVAEGALRTTHFGDAFTRNQALMLRDFHWWVMEYSVDALGTFGTPAVLPTVRHLLANYPDPQPRQRAKLEALTREPRRYLSGPPVTIPEQ